MVEYNAEEETKSYNVHRKTGDYIIGEVGSNKKIDFRNMKIPCDVCASFRWARSMSIMERLLRYATTDIQFAGVEIL